LSSRRRSASPRTSSYLREATGRRDATQSTCPSARPTLVDAAGEPCWSARGGGGSEGASEGGGGGGGGESAERNAKKTEMKACVASSASRRSTDSARAAATGSGRSSIVAPCSVDEDGEKAERKLPARDMSGSIGVRSWCQRCRCCVSIRSIDDLLGSKRRRRLLTYPAMSRRNTRSRAEEGGDKLAVAVRRRLRVWRLIGAVAATWWSLFDRELGVCPFAGYAGKIVVPCSF
jgi:hypothetical protein